MSYELQSSSSRHLTNHATPAPTITAMIFTRLLLTFISGALLAALAWVWSQYRNPILETIVLGIAFGAVAVSWLAFENLRFSWLRCFVYAFALTVVAGSPLIAGFILGNPYAVIAVAYSIWLLVPALLFLVFGVVEFFWP